MMIKDPINTQKQPDWIAALKIFVRLSAWIIAPLLVGLLLGRYLDAKNGSSPKWFLIVTGIAFIVSIYGLIKNANEAYKEIDNVNKREDKDTKK
jgi:F0F1-type ATP synthase assembly protein I